VSRERCHTSSQFYVMQVVFVRRPAAWRDELNDCSSADKAARLVGSGGMKCQPETIQTDISELETPSCIQPSPADDAP